ncbi:hypothetical protein N8Y88_02775 [Saprospiraceae bacterium]|nr:hypothetical protein [Saprospiraceae bacterium]
MKYIYLILCLPFLLCCSNGTNNQEQSNYIKNLEERIQIQEQNNYIRNLEERLKKLESSSNVRTSQDPKITYNDNSYISFCLNFNKGICTKFDLEKVANDIPEIKGKDGGVKDKLTITKKMLVTKNGKIYFHGEDKEIAGLAVDFEIKKDNGVWSLLDPKKDGGEGWIPISEYLTTSSY